MRMVEAVSGRSQHGHRLLNTFKDTGDKVVLPPVIGTLGVGVLPFLLFVQRAGIGVFTPIAHDRLIPNSYFSTHDDDFNLVTPYRWANTTKLSGRLRLYKKLRVLPRLHQPRRCSHNLICTPSATQARLSAYFD